MHEVDAALTDAAGRYAFVLVPGLYDSGPEHWQGRWQTRYPFWKRISQKTWNNPDIELWIGAIRRLLALQHSPAILVGHSFGALASCCLAVERTHSIAGLMLVAPAEPVRFELEYRVPERPLGVPAVVVASHDDPLMRFSRALHWSEMWGAEVVDLGEAGHINAEAGFGPWLYGLQILWQLTERIEHPERFSA